MSTETPDATQTVSDLASEIFYSLFPHVESLPPRHDSTRQKHIPEEARVHQIGKDSVIAVGAVVAVKDLSAREQNSFITRTHRYTMREWLRYERPGYYLVVSATPKTIKVRPLRNLTHGWGTDITAWRATAEDYTERMSLTSKSREIIMLGYMPDLQQQINEHPLIGDWRNAYTAAQEQSKAAQAKRRRDDQNRMEEQRPYNEAAARLNAALGVQAVNHKRGASFMPRFKDEWKWLTQGSNGEVYLNGRVHLGDLAQNELPGAINALRMLLDEPDWRC